jgi:SAM-dependent methyltransferase
MRAWSHTTHYYDRLLRAAPRPCRRALDIGCGVGQFARELAARADHVDALDVSAEVLARARAQSGGVPNLRFVEADFMSYPIEPGAYDFVSLLASLHHLPFAAAIAKIKTALRPGGVLGVIGLWRDRGPRDFVASAVAWPVSRLYRLTRAHATMGAPVSDPLMTWSEIRAHTAALLPGAVVERHLLWRYSLLWTR